MLFSFFHSITSSLLIINFLIFFFSPTVKQPLSVSLYRAAINYLLFEHDEKTGKKIVDEFGRSILRKEFYMDGLNCDPMSFDKECELTNAYFHKNKKREDIKSTTTLSATIQPMLLKTDLPEREHSQSVWNLQSRCFLDIQNNGTCHKDQIHPKMIDSLNQLLYAPTASSP